MGYLVRIDNFEGPFDLLFHLIEKEEVDIYDIPISKITQQYLQYMEQIKKLDLELASEFIVMAATLLEIKSKMLLPHQQNQSKDNEEEPTDPRAELVERLLEYKLFKEIAQILKEKEEERKKLYVTENKQMEEFINQSNYSITNLSVTNMYNTFKKVIEKNLNKQQNIRRIKKEKVTVAMKIRYVLNKLRQRKVISFDELIINETSRLQKITTFLALLELIKKDKIFVYQKGTFDKIKIVLKRERLNQEVAYGSR